MGIINERIKEQRQNAGLTLAQVAEKLNVKEATVQRYESGEIKNIKHEIISKLASIFNCSPAYLMGWEDNKATELSPKAEKDIKKALGETLEQLENSQDALMFDGEPIDDETRELLRSSLENSMRIAKKIAKEKYTPKKYKK